MKNISFASLKKTWLLTLLDLMLLMLTFFIMLYSMTSPNYQKNNALNSLTQPVSTIKRGVHLNYLEQILSNQIQSFDGYRIKKEQKNIQIQIPKIIFADKKQPLIKK